MTLLPTKPSDNVSSSPTVELYSSDKAIEESAPIVMDISDIDLP